MPKVLGVVAVVAAVGKQSVPVKPPPPTLPALGQLHAGNALLDAAQLNRKLEWQTQQQATGPAPDHPPPTSLMLAALD